ASALALTSARPGSTAAAACVPGYWSSRATPWIRAISQLPAATAASCSRCSLEAASSRAAAAAASAAAWARRCASGSVQALPPSTPAASSRERDRRERLGFIGSLCEGRAGRAGARVRSGLAAAAGGAEHGLDRGGGDRVVARTGTLEHLAGEGQPFGRLRQLLVDRHDQLAPADPLDELAGRLARRLIAAAQGQRIPAHGDLAIGGAGEAVGLVQLCQLLGLEGLAHAFQEAHPGLGAPLAGDLRIGQLRAAAPGDARG